MQQPNLQRAALCRRPAPDDPGCGHPGEFLAHAARAAALDLARAGRLDAVLVPRLSHWSCSTPDLLAPSRTLHARGVTLHPFAGPRLDTGLLQDGCVLRLLEDLAAFARELRRERVLRAQATVRAADKPVGRQPGQRPKAGKLAPKVLRLAGQGLPRRGITARLHLSKNTAGGILARTGTAS